MDERDFHTWATWAEIGLGVLTFASLFFITAPYGRHARKGWGPEVSQRTGWILMELPACVGWFAIWAMGSHALETVPLAMMALWQLHYVNRTFVFPFRIKASGKTTPLSIVGTAVAFNLLNAYVNARWVSEFGSYEGGYLMDPRFVVGASIFLVGWGINVHSDEILMKLRKPGESGYKIPTGGMYRWISCPNYFSEILEWTGWAILTWSLAGSAFAIYAFANLAPRAFSHHKWYREKFDDYPKERKALIPFVV